MGRNKATKAFTEDELDLLSGKIRQSSYAGEVQTALKGLGEERTRTYITSVVDRYFYNEQVWRAVIEVLKQRKARKNGISLEVAEVTG